jgi:hypothetical protein
MPNTYYANVINLRITQTEFVLEGGTFFPDRPGVAPPSDYKPDVRLVMNVAVLPQLLDALTKAQTARTAATVTEESKRGPIGFQKP